MTMFDNNYNAISDDKELPKISINTIVILYEIMPVLPLSR